MTPRPILSGVDNGVKARHRAACALLTLIFGLTAAACSSGHNWQAISTRPVSCPSHLQPDHGFQHAARPPRWILTAGGLSMLVQAGLPSSLMRADFNNASTILLVSHGRPDSLAPRASLAFDFTSASALISALDHNRVPIDVPYLLLDLERWPLTPVAEQQNPIGALRNAISVAHAHGKCVIFTPALDLVGAVDPGGRASSIYKRFDRLILRPGAAATDVFEIQAQHTEGSLLSIDLAPSAIAAARAAHPGVPVFVGLSTNPNGQRVTAQDLLEVYDASAAAGASGYWLNIPRAGAECPMCGMPQPRVAVEFLTALAINGSGGSSFRALPPRRGLRHGRPNRILRAPTT